MQFKITIVTGIFCLLISSISIAKPISKNETTPQKTEQTRKKKPNFTKKIIFKKIIKKIKKDRERAKPWSVVSVIFGSLGFLGTVSYLIYLRPLILLSGALLGIIGIITGLAVVDPNSNKKTKTLSMVGTILGYVSLTGAALFFLYVMFLIIRFLVVFF